MAAFKDKLFYFRKKADLTQKELADKCGVSRPLIIGFELGDRSPSLTTLYRLADVLGCSAADLLDDPKES